MGGFDWTGIGGGLGEVGEQYQVGVQRREVTAEKADAKKREAAMRRYQAAQLRLNAVKHLPPGDPQREAAIAEFEAAASELYGVPFKFPRKKITKGAPAPQPTPTPPPAPKPPTGIQEGEPGEVPPLPETPPPGGAPLPGAPGAPPPGPPEEDVADLGPEDEVDDVTLLNQARALVNAIKGASGAQRNFAVATMRAWLASLTPAFRERLTRLLPESLNPDALVGQFEAEEKTEVSAAVAARGRSEWAKSVGEARKNLTIAMRGDNLQVLLRAIQEYYGLLAAGKEAGHIQSSGEAQSAFEIVKGRQQALLWQTAEQWSRITGIPLTPAQQRDRDTELKRRGKVAAPRAGGKKKTSVGRSMI